MIQKLSTDFAAEIKSKQDAFDVTNAHLRAATRELADQRKQIAHWQKRCGDLNQLSQKLQNAREAFSEKEQFDWTGRSQLNSQSADPAAGPAFASRPKLLSEVILPDDDGDAEIRLPDSDSLASLIKLRRMKLHYERINKLLDERLKELEGASSLKEFQCKKIVAMCTGIPIDKVEDVSLAPLSFKLAGTNFSEDAGEPRYINRQ